MQRESQRRERFRQAESMVRIGLAVNAALMAAKLAAGRLGHSEALFADGVESACDLAISAAALATLRFSRQPFDRKHPYGHGRAESLAAFLVGLAIIVTSAAILYAAITAIAAGEIRRPRLFTLFVAAATIALKETLARITFRRAKRLGSPVLSAIARDHRKDALTSIGTLTGCGFAFLGWRVLDPVFAGLTGLMIAHVGIDTARAAASDLIDAALPETHLNAISAIAQAIEGVEHVHEIRGRRSGQYIIVDLKLEMDPAMTVARSHEIATTVKRKIFEADPSVGDVMIHINPHADPEHADLIRL
jgi:cation diffusion facilitator family transporter